MLLIKAPHKLQKLKNSKTVFLAGSIDMGAAVDWQAQVTDHFKDQNVTFFNPRRDDFDPSAEQSINNPYFVEQVEWEMNALQVADVIVYCFDPKGKAPITLLELGLYANTDKPKVVCCPEGFWRKGNVDVVCKRFNIPQVNSVEELCVYLEALV